ARARLRLRSAEPALRHRIHDRPAAGWRAAGGSERRRGVRVDGCGARLRRRHTPSTAPRVDYDGILPVASWGWPPACSHLSPSGDRLNGSSVFGARRDGVSPRPQIDHIRRPQLLRAAADVIVERGLASTRIADVAERAGTSPPAVLYWFRSKDELLAEALTVD